MKSVAQLGFLHFEVKDLAAWEAFGTRVLGLGIASRRGDGGFSLRLDGHAQRIFVTPGGDDLGCLGWEVDSEEALDAVAERLRAAGVAVREGTPEERDYRQVARLIAYADPAGIPSVVYCGPALAREPFVSAVVRSGFVADAQGLGHLVISANSQAESRAFYEQILGFRLSDHIICNVHGYPVNIAFFHASGEDRRHHSVAFGDKQRKRLHHFMIEARAMDEVGMAHDRTLKAGLKIMQTLGRHPNDRMFSFYAKTPSGFQFEFGWGGRSVNDATWETTTYDHISEWGHHPPEFVAAPPPAMLEPLPSSAPPKQAAPKKEEAAK